MNAVASPLLSPASQARERAPRWPLRVRLAREDQQAGRWRVSRWVVAELHSARPESARDNAFGSCADGWVEAPALALFRDEAPAYRFNLSSDSPRLFVICSEPPDEEEPPEVLLVTASQDQAADYLDGDDQAVYSLPMPEAIHCWIEAFIGRTGEPDLGLKRGRRRRLRHSSGEAEAGAAEGGAHG